MINCQAHTTNSSRISTLYWNETAVGWSCFLTEQIVWRVTQSPLRAFNPSLKQR